MKNSPFIRLAVFLSIFSCAAALSSGAIAQGKDAYLQDQAGVIVRSGAGNLCWRTGFWTPASAVAECDPDLTKKADVISPAPVYAATIPCEPPLEPKVSILETVFFDFNKSALKSAGMARLNDLLPKLDDIRLELIIANGHTDGIGSEAYNKNLSNRRAEAVKNFLIGKGVEPNRIYLEGHGKQEPVADNGSPEGRAKNRRVEINVVGTKKLVLNCGK